MNGEAPQQRTMISNFSDQRASQVRHMASVHVRTTIFCSFAENEDKILCTWSAQSASKMPLAHKSSEQKRNGVGPGSLQAH